VTANPGAFGASASHFSSLIATPTSLPCSVLSLVTNTNRASRWHRSLHPSPAIPPRSQPSPGSRFPSPHIAGALVDPLDVSSSPVSVVSVVPIVSIALVVRSVLVVASSLLDVASSAGDVLPVVVVGSVVDVPDVDVGAGSSVDGVVVDPVVSGLVVDVPGGVPVVGPGLPPGLKQPASTIAATPTARRTPLETPARSMTGGQCTAALRRARGDPRWSARRRCGMRLGPCPSASPRSAASPPSPRRSS
jgi:hypothetical protein